MEEDDKPGVKRVRLTGARFDGGRLPVDSLIELQKYQDVVRIAAVAEWQQEHPGESAPEDLKRSISLTIDQIKDGSADVFLVFEQHGVYVEYQAEARDAVDAIIEAAYSDAEIPLLPSLTPEQDSELRETIAQLGSTLLPEQSMEFYPDGPDSSPVRITIETRKFAIDRISRIEDFLVSPDADVKPSRIEKIEESLVGRITALDTNSSTYVLTLPNAQTIKGRYPKHPELLEDLLKVVNSEAVGPLTRVTGDLQYRDGALYRFWETNSVELIEFDETPWGSRLTEFAALTVGWDGGEAAQISSVSLEATQMLMRMVDQAGIKRPGVFPTDEGGVLLEWSSASGVRSVEVLDDGTFETFEITRGKREGTHSTTQDLTVATAFIGAAKA